MEERRKYLTLWDYDEIALKFSISLEDNPLVSNSTLNTLKQRMIY